MIYQERNGIHRYHAVLPATLATRVEELANLEHEPTVVFLRSALRLKRFIDENRQNMLRQGESGEIRIGETCIAPDLLMAKYPLIDLQRKHMFMLLSSQDYRFFSGLAEAQGKKFIDYLREATALQVEVITTARRPDLYGTPLLRPIPISIGSRRFEIII